MPRPKAPKLVRTVPNLNIAETLAARAAQNEAKDLSPASSGRVTNGTNDSDGIVKTKKNGKGVQKSAVANMEYSMSGALAVDETEPASIQPLQKRTVEEVTRIAREADYAALAEDRERSRLGNRNPVTSIVPSQDSLETRKGNQKRSSTVLMSRRPSLMARGQQTPLVQSSGLGSATFQKRARQPSLLQLVNTENTQAELEDSLGDLDDFRPDDESTPLIRSLSQSRPRYTSSSSHLSSGYRKRKLKSPEIQVFNSQQLSDPPESPSETSEDHAPGTAGRESLKGTPNSEADAPDQIPQSPAQQLLSDTMAPPESSPSPEPGEDHLASKARNHQRAGVGHNARPESPDPSPRLLKPQQIHQTRGAKAPKPLTTATLQNLLPRRRTKLRPHKSTYDISSGNENDENEYGNESTSFQATKKQKSRNKLAPMPSQQQRQSMQIQRKSRGVAKSRTKSTTSASPDHAPTTATEENKRVSRTYSRKGDVIDPSETEATSSENEETESFLFPTAIAKSKSGGTNGAVAFDGKAKAEMVRLAKKFREVDEYTLDFEDMTANSGSSQMKDAR